jgi:hypothetical protein
MLAGLVICTALPGCDEEREVVTPPPVPLPKYLSRAITPIDEAATPEAPATPAESAAAPRPVEPTEPTPAEIARQMAELQPALERLQQKRAEAAEAPRPLGPDEAPPIRRGEPPVKVAVRVPLEGDQPAERIDTVGRVRVTAVEAAPGAPVPDREESVSRESNPAAAETAKTVEPPAGPVTLDALTQHYESLARSNPGDVEVARSLRLLYFLAGENERSLEAIDGLPAEEQALWRGLIWTLINARERLPGQTRAAQAAEVLAALDDVRTGLERTAPLGLGTVRFCQSIEDFGSYVPLAVNRFRPGQQALLYSELENFASEKGADDLYRVRLNMVLSLERPDGTAVWQETINGIEDVCRRPRRDFFLTTRIPMPQDVKPGPYALKVTFEDATAGKQAGAQLDVEIAAPGAGP